MKSKVSPQRIFLTTGDRDGIGFEVALKALAQIQIPRNCRVILMRPKGPLPKGTQNLLNSRAVDSTTDNNFVDFLNSKKSSNQIVDFASNSSPTSWVIQAANFAIEDGNSSLVTGPLSKTQIREDGYSFKGHTDLLRTLTKAKDLFMTFMGEHFNVLLLTGHIPLKDISAQFHFEKVASATKALLRFQTLLPHSRRNLPFGLLGLNPHASEYGIIGTEDLQFDPKVLRRLNISKPLAADSAFLPQNWNKYRYLMAWYHDQGLPAFKAVHGHSGGVHLTAGLPFVRTSVEHGTAKEIFGKNKGNPASMVLALKAALKLRGGRI